MKGYTVNRIMEALVLVVIGLSLFGVVLDFTTTAQGNANITATESTLLGLVPIFYVIGLVTAVIFLLVAHNQ